MLLKIKDVKIKTFQLNKNNLAYTFKEEILLSDAFI